MNFADLRRRAAAVLAVPLEAVLIFRGAVRDAHDRCKWHTEQGPLSVTGPKFMNWHAGRGGGGAIDLVIHLTGVDFRTAVLWLEERLAAGPLASDEPLRPGSGRDASLPESPWRAATTPPRQSLVGRVAGTSRHALSCGIAHRSLVESGTLYADSRGNAVFVLVAGKPTGPSLGTPRHRAASGGDGAGTCRIGDTSGSAAVLGKSFFASPRSTP